MQGCAVASRLPTDEQAGSPMPSPCLILPSVPAARGTPHGATAPLTSRLCVSFLHRPVPH